MEGLNNGLINQRMLLAGNDSCPATIFPPESPTFSKYRALFLIILVYPTLIVSTLWMWKRRYFFPLSARHWGLITASGIGIMVAGIISPIRDYVGRAAFPCDLLLFSHVVWFPLITGPLIIRVFLTHNMLKFHRLINTNNENDKDRARLLSRQEHSQSGSSARSLLKRRGIGLGYARLLASPEYGAALVVVVILVSCLLFVYSANSGDQYLRNCTGCSLSNTDILVFSISGVTLMIIASIVLWRSRHENDAFGVLKELRLIFKIFTFSLVIWLPLELVDPNLLSEKEEMNWSFIWFITAVVNHVISTAYQVYLSYKPMMRRKTSTEDLTLENILDDPEGFDCFEEYLVSEFNSINISFWKDAKYWRNEYNSMSPSGRSQIAEFICEDYVSEGGIMQVSLPANVVSKIEKKTDGKHGEAPQNVFDDAIDYIYEEMNKNSFPRFLQSDVFKRYTESVTNDSVSVASRFKHPFGIKSDDEVSFQSQSIDDVL